MNAFFFFVILWFLDNASVHTNTEKNQKSQQAKTAYNQKKFSLAAQYYKEIMQNSLQENPEALLNYGHSLYFAEDYNKAKRAYESVLLSNNKKNIPVAYVQLANIACVEKDTNEGLVLLKKALLLDPNDKIARTNYELLKKKYTPTIKEQALANNSLQNNTIVDSANQEKKETLKTLKNYHLNLEKAQMILDAMKSVEVQYLQHFKTKKSKSPSKHNW